MTVESVKLVECVTLTKGKPPAEMPYFGDDAELYLSPEYLRGKGIAAPAKPAANAVRVKDGDTVLLWDGSNAGEFFRGREGILASTMTHIVHGEEFEPEYFCYATKRWEAYLKGQTSGSGIPHVDKEVLGKLEILKLPPDEQKLVANILSKLDRAIEQTEALIAKQQRIKTGLMQDLLTKGIDAHGNIRSEATHAFKDSPLGRIPVEWSCLEIQTLLKNGDLLLVQDGNHGEAYPRSSAFTLEGVPFISAKHIDKFGRIDFESAPKLPNEYLGKLRIGFGAPGDIVFAHNATVGPVGYVEAADSSYIASTSTTIYRANESTLLGKYVFCFLMSEHYQLQTANIMGQTTRNQVPITAQKRLHFLLPKPDEQAAITEKISSVIGGLLSTENNLIKLVHLKAGLMHDLLTGDRRVTALFAPAVTQ